jgi:glutathione S-transferase
MPITLYDLAGANPALRFSPYCWRTKLALRHKGLDYETIPWRLSDRAAIAPTGQARVPSLLDSGLWVHDSWKIATYLDETYPDRPPLFPDDAAKIHARFINSWCDWSVLPNSRTLAVPEVFKIIAEQDKAYFRASREKAFGVPLEQIGLDKAAAKKTFEQGLKPAEVTLTDHPFLHGAAPGYGDFALFGTLLWPYMVCKDDPIDHATAVGEWFDKMLARDGGWVAVAPTVRSLGK